MRNIFGCFRRSTLTRPSLIDQLATRTKENTRKFSFVGQTYNAKCVDIYDGDTITAVFYFKDDYYQFKIRLIGIDTPEIRNKDLEKKAKAISARDFLRNKLLNKQFVLECHEFGKYGRTLGTVWLDEVNINKLMIDSGHAVPYGS